MEMSQTFIPGQTVRVLTDDGILFVGSIIACEAKIKCDFCDDRKNDHKDDCKDDHKNDCKDDHKDKDDDGDCERFLVLQLEQDVEIGTPSEIAFEEGDTVFINFCQIIAIALGFPPTKKGG